jgi:transcriptional regulator with XRE-family HTH domain
MGELDRAAICARIQQAREEAGLTQPELADLLHVHWRTVQTWESVKQPRVPWDRLDEIARATDKTKDWLLQGDERAPSDDRLARVEEQVGEVRQLVEDLLREFRDEREDPPAASSEPR